MEVTRRNRNNAAVNNSSSRDNSLVTWGPLISRLTKMAVKYAQSGASSNFGSSGVGGGAISTQYSYGGTKRRGPNKRNSKNQSTSLSQEGIPRGVGVTVINMVLTGDHLLQSNNGFQSAKWYLGDLGDADDLLMSQSLSVKALLKAFTCWKYQRVVCKFVPCLAMTDGGYHCAVAKANVDPIAAVTPYEITQRKGKTESIRVPLTVNLVPTHNDGTVHYDEGLSLTELEERKTGTILYYIAGGPQNFQPISVMNYTVHLALWNN